ITALPIAYAVTGTAAYCAGGTGVAVGLANSESGVNYQLKNGATDVGSPVSGTGTAISFGDQTTAATYTVLATKTAGSCTNTMTGSAVVSITALPIAYAVTGTAAYCAGGTGVAVGLANSESGVNYQLKNGATDVGSPVSGTGAAISFGNQTTAATYTVLATKTAGSCTNTMTGSAVVSITALPIAYAVTGTAAYCSGGTGVAVGLANSESGVNYQLKNGATDVGSPVSGTGAAISFGNQTTAATYTVLATKTAGSCTNTMTGSAVVSITALPIAYAVTGTAAYCAGGTGVAVGLANSESGVNYQLKNGATDVGSPVSGTGAAISFGNQTTAATYTVLATKTAGSCTNTMTGSAVVSITALPIAYAVTGTAAYCAGGTGVAVGLANSESGVNYQLKNGATDVGSPVSGTGAAISFGNQTTAATYTVLATKTAGSCTNTMTGSAVVSITALPIAYAVTGTAAYCAGGTGVAVGLANSESGVNYQLKNGATDVGSPVSGTGTAISFGNQTAAATYTVLATRTAGSCTNTMTGSAVVSITALPIAYAVTGTAAYCAGGTGVAVGLANSESGVNYQLKNGATDVGSPVSGTGAAISFGNQTTAATYTVLATKTVGSCTNTMTGSAVVSITALPIAYAVTGTAAYCAGGTGVAVGLANSENGVNYQL
ncbi:beta strand repeat-containing protein, partial [Flavobacterium taihuense]